MKIVAKSIDDLSDEEYRWCYNANLCSLNYDGYGSMRPKLAHIRTKQLIDPTARAVMLIDERYSNARALVAWALIFERVNAYFWTKPHMRNKGYGTMLMRAVKEEIPMPVTYPWTDESGGFFSKFYCINGYGAWAESLLTSKPKVC